MLTFFSSSAQKIKPLTVGDQVPDIVLQKMLNHTDTSGKLSDFSGKAIIIDQWFIACVPCISAMPKLDSLQKEFGDVLQILPVTFEKKSAVKEFWRSNIIVTGIQMKQVVEDTLVRAYFPAISFPQQVWINKDRIVVAITDGKNTTKSNLIKLINGEKILLSVKSDEMDIEVRNALKPNMITRYEENKNKLLFYSYLSKYRKELAGWSFSKLDTAAKIVRVLNNNKTLLKLYDFAYANNSWEPRHLPTRMIRKDSCPYQTGTEEIVDTTSQFCYELMYSGYTTKGFSKYMISDLDKFFKIKSHEEFRDIECIVISPNGKGLKYRTTYQPNRKSYSTFSLKKLKRALVNDVPLFLVQRNLIQLVDDIPVLIECPGNDGKINFDVRWDLSNLDLMNKDLVKFDLKIERVFRKRKVIILEDI
ncbi:TlpA family protein disulfide reductase [Pedobacter xixiisoli]|uniref:Thiol-disulfide isomerase or thioredoxin n=2 Tax=Pedobacter xixiisoli TaxID=1476464 RepID=A0A286A7B6_9SPHI|nr:redoxin domain-containing protein [Pedobacter xixiisoli]SOD17721.1 Thiol-disulfide isomerase or thioredoxin [Pedobacter xixiisoli]